MSPRPHAHPDEAELATGLSFDNIATARDDGLLPAFRQLFAGLSQAVGRESVTDIARSIPVTHRQSGPNPRGPGDPHSAPGIIRFPGFVSHKQRAQGKRTGKEA